MKNQGAHWSRVGTVHPYLLGLLLLTCRLGFFGLLMRLLK